MKENVLIGLSSIAIILSIIAIVSVFIVPTSNISVNAVGEKQLADNSVSSDKLINGTITDNEISDSGISKITDSAITSDKIIDDAVTTDKIADNAVTTDKLANDVLNWENIENKPLEVIAAGKISRTGIIYKGYNIESVDFNQDEGLYDITISGVNYSQKLYITLVTPEYSHVSVGVVRNYEWLRVVVRENGYVSESGFDFVVYDINNLD